MDDVTESRIEAAEESLRRILGDDALAGRTFLDVGSGSGLFSLAALRLRAARVHSFDYDEESVAATRALADRAGAHAIWTIERGDATDPSYMSGLGEFDVVYSWGVLHHTGAMWDALANTADRVGAGGLLYIAIYNDQGRKSGRWRRIKQLYNGLPRPLRAAYAVAVMLPWEARMLAGATARGRPGDYVRGWAREGGRGMSRWHDLLDWVGGFPFEVAAPEDVFRFCRDRGFELVELTTAVPRGGIGCNEFVFRRAGRT